MSNRDIYKAAMSGVHHSNDALERIFDMTVGKKKLNSKQIFKRIASAALALVILAVGGGFGANAIVQTNKENQPLTVMVAYASDKGKLSLGSKSEQKIFYGIYTAPMDDKKACEEALNRWQKDTAELMNQIDEKPEGASASFGKGSSACSRSKDHKETAVFYTLQGGFFELSLEDYTNVKSFKVENTSDYGLLYFDYCSKQAETQEDNEYIAEYETEAEQLEALGFKHSFDITGDELRYSQKNGSYTKGIGKYEENKGYFLDWQPSAQLKEAIGNNPSFDLSQIKDTITFTVELNDGTVKTASLNLYFDSDGYMYFE